MKEVETNDSILAEEMEKLRSEKVPLNAVTANCILLISGSLYTVSPKR